MKISKEILQYSERDRLDIVRNLRWADLRGANLSGANLSEANLREANLREADLRRANLRGANLSEANLREANLQSPAQMLLCMWGYVSEQLCGHLMRYDAANCPDGESLFSKWATGGGCPYSGQRIQRAANFQEHRALWSPGPAKSALELMIMLFREKCSDSDWHDHEGDK